MILQSVNAPTAGPTLPLTGQASAGSHTCPLTRQQPGSSPINLVAACHQAKTWPAASKAQTRRPLLPPLYHCTPTPTGGAKGWPVANGTKRLDGHPCYTRSAKCQRHSLVFQEHGSTEIHYTCPLQHLCRGLALVGSLLKGWALDRNALAVRRSLQEGINLLLPTLITSFIRISFFFSKEKLKLYLALLAIPQFRTVTQRSGRGYPTTVPPGEHPGPSLLAPLKRGHSCKVPAWPKS